MATAQAPNVPNIPDINEALTRYAASDLETLMSRLETAVAIMERQAYRGIDEAAEQSAEVKKKSTSIKSDAKKLYGLHVKSVIQQAKKDGMLVPVLLHWEMEKQ